jgi:hypothetical protein
VPSTSLDKACSKQWCYTNQMARRRPFIPLPIPMREQIEDAAIDCGSVTFAGALALETSIKREAYEIAGQMRRVVTVEVSENDVIVSFTLAAA